MVEQADERVADLERHSHELAAALQTVQLGESLAAVYTVCDCFVCPSVTETFGQTINEALASGVPVAVPRVGCFVEAYDGLLDAFLSIAATSGVLSLLSASESSATLADVCYGC